MGQLQKLNYNNKIMNKWEKYESLKKRIIAKSSEDYEKQIKEIIKLLNV